MSVNLQELPHIAHSSPAVAAPAARRRWRIGSGWILPVAVLALRYLTLGEHLAQHAAQSILAARPLHGAGISQIFALARYGGLEQLSAKPAHKTCSLNKCAKPLREYGLALAHALAKVMDQLQAKHHACQLHIQPGVAFAQMR